MVNSNDYIKVLSQEEKDELTKSFLVINSQYGKVLEKLAGKDVTFDKDGN